MREFAALILIAASGNQFIIPRNMAPAADFTWASTEPQTLGLLTEEQARKHAVEPLYAEIEIAARVHVFRLIYSIVGYDLTEIIDSYVDRLSMLRSACEQ